MYLFLFPGEIKAKVFAGTCPGGWGAVLSAGTWRRTDLWSEADVSGEAFTWPQGICFGKLRSQQRSLVHFAWGV